MDNLKGRTALLTGASRGIGPYIARALAREGVHLALAARSAADLETVAEQVRSSGSGIQVLAVPVDVRRDEDREKLLARVTSELGPVDILINNAAIENVIRYESQDPEDIAAIIETNLVAPMQLTRALLPGMLDRGAGHIVNVASLAGKVGIAYGGPYSASKGGLIQFTESLRMEFRRRGVSASVICPGFVGQAGMYAKTMRETGVSAPRLAGTSSPQAVARAVVRSIRRDLPEIIVNPGPMRLITTLAELAPRVFERGYDLLGPRRQYAEVADRRTKE